MAYLRLNFFPILSADRNILPMGNDLFAEIVLEVSDGEIIRTIFSLRWDIRCLIDWFLKFKKSLLDEECLDFLDISKPTIFAIDEVFDNYDEASLDAVVELLYEFRLTHDLRFAMRGTNIPSVIICKKESSYEISWKNLGKYHACQIDLQKFITALYEFSQSDVFTSTKPRYLSESICLK